MMRALELLYHLDALDIASNLTATGKMLAELPLEPQLGKMLLESVQMRLTYIQRICELRLRQGLLLFCLCSKRGRGPRNRAGARVT
eukprot:3282681-Pleurochrysis_carterae.AAC.2